MSRVDYGTTTVNPYQQVVHGPKSDGLHAVSPQDIPAILNALAAQLQHTRVGTGSALRVRIGTLRIVIADPATLESLGLRRRLGAGS